MNQASFCDDHFGPGDGGVVLYLLKEEPASVASLLLTILLRDY